MGLIINIPDSLRRAVECASQGKNTVLYTAKGQPCYMVVIPKFTVDSIDASLGAGTHPAFVVNGVEKDAIYVGQHLGCLRNGELLSLPVVDPHNTVTHDESIALARANGAGWHVMSNVEYAAIALWCWKNGYQPRGNTNSGLSSDVVSEYGIRSDGGVPGVGGDDNSRTRTGSGPVSWRHDNTPFGIADLNGNVWEWTPGLRVNSGEIQILPDNDAALAAADLSATSTGWKAIDGETGTLVAPGTAGTCMYCNGGTPDYSILSAGGAFSGFTNPGGTPIAAPALQVLMRAALYPIADHGLGDDYGYASAGGPDMLPVRGGYWDNAANAGVFALDVEYDRASANAGIGCRPAFVI